MNRAALRNQMAEVVRAARAARRDPTCAPDLWGCTSQLCDALERESDGSSQRVVICTALREDIRSGARCMDDLVEEIVWFVRVVEQDIDEEELEAIADGVVTADQVDG